MYYLFSKYCLTVNHHLNKSIRKGTLCQVTSNALSTMKFYAHQHAPNNYPLSFTSLDIGKI